MCCKIMHGCQKLFNNLRLTLIISGKVAIPRTIAMAAKGIKATTNCVKR